MRESVLVKFGRFMKIHGAISGAQRNYELARSGGWQTAVAICDILPKAATRFMGNSDLRSWTSFGTISRRAVAHASSVRVRGVSQPRVFLGDSCGGKVVLPQLPSRRWFASRSCRLLATSTSRGSHPRIARGLARAVEQQSAVWLGEVCEAVETGHQPHPHGWMQRQNHTTNFRHYKTTQKEHLL
jgi:hypothetical protein